MIPKPPWNARKEAYIARIGGEPWSVRMVTCADKLHNAQCVLADYREHGEKLWERFNKESGRDGQLWYHRAVANALLASGPARMAAELDRVVSQLEQLVQGRTKQS